MAAGGSAQEEYERRRDERVARLRARALPLAAIAVVAAVAGSIIGGALGVPGLGAVIGLLAAATLLVPDQREVAWRRGAEGEVIVARALEGLGPDVIVLHDLRIPGSRANIDHVVIGPSGVWTVDAKRYRGRVETRRRGAELWVASRNRSKLLEQATRQARVVSDVLATAGLGSIPVRAALCFVGAEWPLLGRPQTAGGVTLLTPRRLGPLRAGGSSLPPVVVQRAADALRRALPPATTGTPSAPSVGARPPSAFPGPPVRPTAPAPPAPPRPRANGYVRTPSGTHEVHDWRRPGRHRLYVRRVDSTALGYLDVLTNEVTPTHPSHRDELVRAAQDHLRS